MRKYGFFVFFLMRKSVQIHNSCEGDNMLGNENDLEDNVQEWLPFLFPSLGSLSLFCWCFSLNYSRVVSSKCCNTNIEAQFILLDFAFCVFENLKSLGQGFSSHKSNWDSFEQFSDELLIYLCLTFTFKWKLSLGLRFTRSGIFL